MLLGMKNEHFLFFEGLGILRPWFFTLCHKSSVAKMLHGQNGKYSSLYYFFDLVTVFSCQKKSTSIGAEYIKTVLSLNKA